MNRLGNIEEQFTGSPQKNMSTLLSYLNDPEIIPQPDKYYVFVYKAKTPNIQYDQHPLIQCIGVYQNGFTGFNYHWNEARQYSWGEVLSNLYELSDEEFNIVQDIPIAYFRTT